MKFTCKCGKTVEHTSRNVGAYNVGEAEDETGWHWHSCQYTNDAVWLCPECNAKAQAIALQLLEIVKTPYFYVPGLLPREVVDKWCDENQ